VFDHLLRNLGFFNSDDICFSASISLLVLPVEVYVCLFLLLNLLLICLTAEPPVF